MRDYHYDDVDVKNDRRYSWRKRYQRGYGEESASPALKKVLDSMYISPGVKQIIETLRPHVNGWKERKRNYE